MYCVTVQDANTFQVKRAIFCETLSKVQEVLEVLEPMMDCSYLMTGDNTNITWDNNVYSFCGILDSSVVLNEYNETADS